MRFKFTQILMLTAWLLATGVQWDVVQVVAWGRMFANNARVLPLRDAWELTFATNGMCGACYAVQDAKQAEAAGTTATVSTTAKEPLVIPSHVQIVIAAPTAQPWIVVEPGHGAHERAQPLTPPPRAEV